MNEPRRAAADAVTASAALIAYEKHYPNVRRVAIWNPNHFRSVTFNALVACAGDAYMSLAYFINYLTAKGVRLPLIGLELMDV